MDLAELMRLKSQKVRWVAYHGDERIGLGATETELYQLCTQRGLKEEEFYVGQIGPQPPEVVLLPPIVSEKYTFTNRTPASTNRRARSKLCP